MRVGHLMLKGGWPEVVRSLRDSPVLQVINVLGPRVLAHEAGQDVVARPKSYCDTCHDLATLPGVDKAAEAVVSRPSWELFKDQVLRLRSQDGDPTLSHYEIDQLNRSPLT